MEKIYLSDGKYFVNPHMRFDIRISDYNHTRSSLWHSDYSLRSVCNLYVHKTRPFIHRTTNLQYRIHYTVLSYCIGLCYSSLENSGIQDVFGMSVLLSVNITTAAEGLECVCVAEGAGARWGHQGGGEGSPEGSLPRL